MITSKQAIRKHVADLLESNNITQAPVSVEEIARQGDVVVEYLDNIKEHISGFSFQKDGKKIAGINKNESPLRQRFTLAHELGHIHLGIEDLHYDNNFGLQLRSELSSTGIDKSEVAANFFAAELLMPINFLEKDIGEVAATEKEAKKVVAKLASKYQVSSEAMSVRLASLGYLQTAIL